MTTPTERDLSYRDAQRAAANATRGTWAHLNGRVTPGQMPRRIRLGLRAIVYGAGSAADKCKATARLLGVTVLDARVFLTQLDVKQLERKTRAKARAFNAPPHHPIADGYAEPYKLRLAGENRAARNAAKAQRRARRAQ